MHHGGNVLKRLVDFCEIEGFLTFYVFIRGPLEVLDPPGHANGYQVVDRGIRMCGHNRDVVPPKADLFQDFQDPDTEFVGAEFDTDSLVDHADASFEEKLGGLFPGTSETSLMVEVPRHE